MTSQVNYTRSEKVALMALISARVREGEEIIRPSTKAQWTIRSHGSLFKQFPAAQRKGGNEVTIAALPCKVVDGIYDGLLSLLIDDQGLV